jgi:transposase
VRDTRIWAAVLRVERAVVERVEYGVDGGVLVAHVRPVARERGRCGVCRRRCPRYDAGRGRRRWRTLDLGATRAFVEAEAPRVRCRRHGVVTAAVPWARHGAGHTRAFDDTVAWLATHCSKSAVTELMRVSWRTVGHIVDRVWRDADSTVDRFAGLRRIGIDEISYKKGHKYLTVVVDHDTGRLVWAADGHDAATLETFFDQLGPERSAQITHVSSDAARWIIKVVGQRCPAAVRCADPFHVVKWGTEALDVVRRESWNRARRRASQHSYDERGRRVSRREAEKLKWSRWALWKNPENLTSNQQAKLAWIAFTDPHLYRAYLLKEGLRYVFKIGGEEGKEALDRWISWARRCRIGAFVQLQRTIVKHRQAIEATLDHHLSNALIESMNTKIRLITRRAFGFHGPSPLIALAMLGLSGHPPTLPGRI